MVKTTEKLIEALEILKWLSSKGKSPIMEGREIDGIEFDNVFYKFKFKLVSNPVWISIDLTEYDLREFYYLKEKGELS